MTWTAPVLSLGWILALIVLILDVLLKMMGVIDLPVALVVAALAAMRL